MEIQKRIEELMEIEDFRNALSAASTPEEVIAVFGKEGIEVPYEIANELFTPATEAELDEDALDDVAGGGIGSIVGGALGQQVFYGAGYLGGRLAGWDKKKSKAYASTCGKIGNVLGGALGSLIGG